MSSSNMKVEGDKLSVSDDKKGIIQSPCAFQEGKFSSPSDGDGFFSPTKIVRHVCQIGQKATY